MLVIIDGGSTKADWRIRHNDDTIQRLTTTGFNPNYEDENRIKKLLGQGVSGSMPLHLPARIYYYGAGCWDVSRKEVVKRAFASLFEQADIQIDHDLLAAARATCGDEPGISCILGTGSNSLLYDGNKEVDNVTNLGFLLGDEGSGAMIGKRLVQAYFYREMPNELHYIMDAECPNGKMDILNQVYKGGVPAAYLATFTKKYFEHMKHPYIWKLIKDCFDEFLRRHVFKYENYTTLPIHFVGSVAYHFSEILKELMQEYQLNTGVILQKPIDALMNYHLTRSADMPG